VRSSSGAPLSSSSAVAIAPTAKIAAENQNAVGRLERDSSHNGQPFMGEVVQPEPAVPPALRPEHFEFFAQPVVDRDPAVRDEIRATLAGLWVAVEARLSGPEQNEIRDRYVGAIESDDGSSWAQTRRDQGQQAVNLTIELGSWGITANAVGWTKPQMKLIADWLRKPGRRSFWQENQDFELAIYVRRAHTSGARPVWQGALGELRTRVPASEMVKKGFTVVRMNNDWGLDKHSEHLAYHVKRGWRPEETIGTPSAWLDDLAGAARRLLPIPREANAPTSW
jgi:hypothetical protein